VATYDQASDLKANVIKVYFASENGIGTANTDPTDFNTLGYGRLGTNDALQWPPDLDAQGNWTDSNGNYTAADDYFRLVQWDAVNIGAGIIAFNTNAQGLIPDAIIQTHHNDLQSTSFPGILSQAEIGLHALGDGALNAYFDDFGIRIDVSQNNAIPAPLQQ